MRKIALQFSDTNLDWSRQGGGKKKQTRSSKSKFLKKKIDKPYFPYSFSVAEGVDDTLWNPHITDYQQSNKWYWVNL